MNISYTNLTAPTNHIYYLLRSVVRLFTVTKIRKNIMDKKNNYSEFRFNEQIFHN